MPAETERSDGTGKKRRSKSRVRAQIIEGARVAFLQHGYELATMDMIAKYADVARASLYYQFRDKEELFTSLMREYVHDWAADAARIDAAGVTGWPKLRIAAIQFIERACSPESLRFYRVVIGESERLPWLASLFYENGPKLVAESFRAIFVEIDRAGIAPIADPAAAADHLFGMLMGSLYLRRALNLPDPVLDRSLETFVDGVIAALRR